MVSNLLLLNLFSGQIKNLKINTKWMNWQSVAELTLNLIEDKEDKFITK